jgi:hypothetical protein
MPNTNADGFHENEKTDPNGHDVTQTRADGSSAVLIDNSHGANGVIRSDGSSLHDNTHDDQHGVLQIRAGGDHLVIVTNANGTNTVIHSDDGTTVHTNTMHDGWVV